MEAKKKYFLRSFAITTFLFLGIFVFSVHRASALTYASTAAVAVWATLALGLVVNAVFTRKFDKKAK
jgi:hypothetical protein